MMETWLGDLDFHLIAQGRHWNLADRLGAHPMRHGGHEGVRFAVWAPNAQSVSVVGDFNGWNADVDKMYLHRNAGVWEAFVTDARPGQRYKYALHDAVGRLLPFKADPLARQTELPPATASVVPEAQEFVWTDADWLAERPARQSRAAPMSIYEVHFGSWRRPAHGESLWDREGRELIRHVADMGFTHIELLPVTEHPFGGSWGYQPLGMFAPSARYGTPAEFAGFVDECHNAGLAVIMDWVPAHFPDDAHGLANFDGTALYEHADPRQGIHPDWDTRVYNVGREEVRNFLIASALYWLHNFHVDGLRVDAVASMLYLDYSRAPGQWVPNRFGGNQNLEAVDFLRELNETVTQQCPGAIVVAEESTAWPKVTASAEQEKLGFHYKWNMGWMHDSLAYMQQDPVHRRYHHNAMTFSIVYAWTERFILPLSHDEVVHGKGSLLNKMPGDSWQRFANLRAYYGYMWGHPGKKLLFMGSEIGQMTEWDHDSYIDWDVLSSDMHAGVQRLVQDVNTLYLQCPALYANDTTPEAFSWVIGDDAENSVFAFWRVHGDTHVLVVSNMTPVTRYHYRVGVPVSGQWHERLNTDAHRYGGSNLGNMGCAQAEPVKAHSLSQSLALTLPPLATLFFVNTGAQL